MKKSDRQLAYILLLQAGRCRTAQQLADHFEVSKRTVYRDILALMEAGVPIVSIPGKGYEIMSHYYLPPVRLTLEEATGLFIGSQLALQQTDASLRPNLNSAMLKIETALPGEVRTQLHQLKEVIHLATLRQSSSLRETKYLTAISRAILDHQLVRLQYRAFYTDEVTHRDVEPLWLLYYSSHWHLIGYCRLRGDLRDFRTDRIERFESLDEKANQRLELSLSGYLTQHRQEQAKENQQQVQMRFTKSAARLAKEWLHWLPYQEEADGDAVVLTFQIENDRWIAGWALSFGDQAEVLSPPSLRTGLREMARRALDQYESRPKPVTTRNWSPLHDTVYSTAS